MKAIDKLLKFLQADNVADLIDEDVQRRIADCIHTGYEIDEDSRKTWLSINKEAVKLIKYAENADSDVDKNFPFDKASKVVYPLLGPAVIQLSSRLIPHLVRNGKVCECEVLGQDQPEINPQTGQPTGRGISEVKATKLRNYASYKLMVRSPNWILDKHKICTILAGWGTAFEEEYWDPVTKEICTELLVPEDVIVNTKSGSLEKARRITIRQYMSRNDIVEQIRVNRFTDIDLDQIGKNQVMDNSKMENDPREENPIYEILKQYFYYDLDEDGYEEPYCGYIINGTKDLLGIHPAFDIADVQITPKGEIQSIKSEFPIIDYHCIDDPEGNFYSLGLNHLLLHPNKSTTSLLRQLIDAGTLSNVSSTTGFFTKAFKTSQRVLRYKMGEFIQVDTPPEIDLRTQITNLPVKEPSQVLLALLQLMIEGTEKSGFMSDILTGDTQMQNVPATTALAMTEQATRAFAPLVSKLYKSLEKGFKIWFKLNSKYLDQTSFKYDQQFFQISKEDFDSEIINICPVADPTTSSDAMRYSRLQALRDLVTNLPQAHNIPACLNLFYTELNFPDPQILIAPPAQKQPDPKMLEVQLQGQVAEQGHQIDMMKQENDKLRIQLENKKLDQHQQEIDMMKSESQVKTAKMIADAHKDALMANNQTHAIHIQQQNADTEDRRVDVMEKDANKKDPGT